MNDVGKPLEEEGGCDHVILTEFLQCFDADGHELLSFLVCAGGEVF